MVNNTESSGEPKSLEWRVSSGAVEVKAEESRKCCEGSANGLAGSCWDESCGAMKVKCCR